MKLNNNNFEEVLNSIANKRRISYKNIKIEVSVINNKLNFRALPSFRVLAISFVGIAVLIGVILIVFKKEGFEIFGRVLAFVLLLSVYPISLNITKKLYKENIKEFYKIKDKYEEIKFFRQN